MINVYDLGTMRMLIVPLGNEILENGESRGQMMFSQEALLVINARIEAGEYTSRAIEQEAQADVDSNNLQSD